MSDMISLTRVRYQPRNLSGQTSANGVLARRLAMVVFALIWLPAGFCLLAAVSVEHILRAIKGLIDPASVPRHRPLAGLETGGNAP